MAPRTRTASSLASILLLPAAAAAQVPEDIVKGPFTIGLEPVTSVGATAIDLAHANDGTNRLFIGGQTNADVRVYKNNALLATPFIDLNATTGVTGAALAMQTGGEMGLLGTAFHPNFAVPGQPGFGKFYTYTSENKGASIAGVDFIHDEQDDANLGHHDSVIREWRVNPSNPDQILIDQTSTTTRQNSGRVVMRIRQPQSNHNGGAMKFGPDGMLYIALGDGGGGNDASSEPDGHTDASASPFRPRGNAQDVTDYALDRNENVFGKILRIDPRDPATTSGAIGPVSVNGKYRVPSDNPRMGATDGADEIFAYGLRNPFRMSFDRVGGGLYVGDVGQTQREEIDRVTSGGNYGWVYREGTISSADMPAGFTSVAPIGEYAHFTTGGASQGVAVIGGYVYRGQNIPELYGKYLFGELGAGGAGRLFHMEAGGGAIEEFSYMLNAPSAQLYSFGEDRDGELYAMFEDGTVRRILGRQWFATTGGSWGTAGNWLQPGGGVPNAIGAAANFLGRVSAPASVPAVINLDGNRTVGSMLFNNDVINAQGISYRIAQGTGGGTLSINNGAAVAPVNVIKGNHEITAPVSVVSNADINVAAGGTLNVTNGVTVAASRTLTKKGSGRAGLRGGLAMQSTSTLAVTGGTLDVRNVSGGTVNVNNARLNVLQNGTAVGTSKVAALNVSNNGTLDLADNKLIVASGDLGTSDGTTYTGLTRLIQTAYAESAWTGPGVTTSMADATSGLTALAIATAEQTGHAGGTFGGVPVVGSDVLIFYTYGGDTNFDGKLDADDYGTIDFNVLLHGPVGGYYNGDFNYDGVVNADDYGVIDFNILAQTSPFPTGGAVSYVSAVPEPTAALICVGMGSIRMLRRRRRCRRWCS